MCIDHFQLTLCLERRFRHRQTKVEKLLEEQLLEERPLVVEERQRVAEEQPQHHRQQQSRFAQ